MKRMRIVVLGGNGFIGSHLVDELLKHNYEIVVFDRSPDLFREENKSIKYFYGDFKDSSLLFEILYNANIVFHLINSSLPFESNNNIQSDIENTLLPTLKLLEIINTLKIKKLIYLSSGGAIYGNSNSIITEDHPTNPNNSYGIIKLTIEKYIKLYALSSNFKYLIFRPSNPYGPRQRHIGIHGVINSFVYNIIKNNKITVWGDGSFQKDYLSVTDLVEGIVKSIPFEESEIYNIGSGIGHSLNEIIYILRKAFSNKFEVEYIQKKNYDIYRNVLDISKFSSKFDWQPRVELKRGIMEHIKWMEKNIGKY